jgi:hypothetical protein
VMQFYSGPLIHFLSGVDNLPGANRVSSRESRKKSEFGRASAVTWARLPSTAYCCLDDPI